MSLNSHKDNPHHDVLMVVIITTQKQNHNLANMDTLTDTAGAPVPGTEPRCCALQVGALPS